MWITMETEKKERKGREEGPGRTQKQKLPLLSPHHLSLSLSLLLVFFVSFREHFSHTVSSLFELLPLRAEPEKVPVACPLVFCQAMRAQSERLCGSVTGATQSPSMQPLTKVPWIET